MYRNGEEIQAAIEDLRTRVAALEARPDADAIVRRINGETVGAIESLIARRLDPSELPSLPPAD